MISRYRVSLDNAQLDELIPPREIVRKDEEGEKTVLLDNGVVILDVSYTPLEKQVRQTSVANLDGYDVASVNYRQRTVTVTFELHLYDVSERNKACQTINAWAQNGGKLRINDREGQYLIVACQQFADIASTRNWTDPLTLVFTTTIVPYWLSDEPTILTLKGASPSGVLNLDGNFGFSPVSIEAYAQNTAVTSFKATVGSTTISMTGFVLPIGSRIIIDYPSNRYIRVLVNGANSISKVSASSSDRLLAECGKGTRVSLTANGQLNVTVGARGQWI